VPVARSIMKEDDIYAELGEIISGKLGRASDAEVTIFDAAGIPIEDLAVAWDTYQKAAREGIGAYMDFVGLGNV